MKIYCQYGACKTLKPTKGDFTTEIGMCRALSQFAEVYYGGQRFRPERSDYGLKDYPGSIAANVPQDADVYYIRASREALEAAPKDKPKIWICSPWDEHAFKTADYIGTLTHTWEEALRAGTPIPILNPNGFKPRRVVTLGQVVHDHFTPRQGSPQVKAIRRRVGGKFIIGCFGRLVESNYPYALIEAWPRIVKEFPQVHLFVTVTKGSFPPDLPNTSYLNPYPHYQMPDVYSACDLIYTPCKGFTWPVRGSVRTLEAAACGVPILLYRSEAREEHLGKDYELFLPEPNPDRATARDTRILRKKLQEVIRSRDLCTRVGRSLPAKTKPFQVIASGKRLRKVFRRLVKEFSCGC